MKFLGCAASKASMDRTPLMYIYLIYINVCMFICIKQRTTSLFLFMLQLRSVVAFCFLIIKMLKQYFRKRSRILAVNYSFASNLLLKHKNIRRNSCVTITRIRKAKVKENICWRSSSYSAHCYVTSTLFFVIFYKHK